MKRREVALWKFSNSFLTVRILSVGLGYLDTLGIFGTFGTGGKVRMIIEINLEITWNSAN